MGCRQQLRHSVAHHHPSTTAEPKQVIKECVTSGSTESSSLCLPRLSRMSYDFHPIWRPNICIGQTLMIGEQAAWPGYLDGLDPAAGGPVRG
jgi:hypothetical protein